jgi:transcriptional regulator with XRE-family HTH domain
MQGKKLKTILWEKGMTQRDLSKMAGIPESYISYFVRDKFLFDKSQRIRIANVLGVAEKDLFQGEK